MHEIDQLYELYKLKQVNRKTVILKRNESTAEHIYSTIMLAKYFLKKIKDLDENKVINLILYHDLCEIYAGDTFTSERTEITNRKEQEATIKLSKIIPTELSKEFLDYWNEWLAQETNEAKFAKAMDKLDPPINELYNMHKWKEYGYTEKMLRKTKEKYLLPFPELIDFFEEMIIEYKKRGLIKK
jgi:putative hydrolases of HD superfamily